MTLAPNSARPREIEGPAITRVRSTTFNPANGLRSDVSLVDGHQLAACPANLI